MAYKLTSKKLTGSKGRRTYKSRSYPGRNGPFHYKQKYLFRYATRANLKKGLKNENEIDQIVNNCKSVLAEVLSARRETLKKGREYYEKALKKYCPVDTGMLRDGFKVKIVNGWLGWENKVKYVYAQNYGKEGVTPTGGRYILYGYHFLEKAALDTFIYMKRLMEQDANRVKSKARQRGMK